MSRVYSSLDAAEFVGTTPRLLRRFIRQNDSWKNATHAGRYSFSQSEVEALKKQFDKWQSGRNRRSSPSKVDDTFEDEDLQYLDEDPGLSEEMVAQMHKNPAIRAQVLAKRRARNAKLMARMKEVGLTIG